LRYDRASCQRIATEAVQRVYQHTSSWQINTATPRQIELLNQREELGKRFRSKYSASDAYPHFVGVFDTVASLSNPVALTGLIAALTFALGVFGFLLWIVSVSLFKIFLGLTATSVAAIIAIYFIKRIRVVWDLPNFPWYRTLHLTESRMNFYDKTLNPHVKYARHAISIDETRSSFQRVPWGDPSQSSAPDRFKQVWFPGNHSDVGGSYPENESRLSDGPLEWMVTDAVSAGLLVDSGVMHRFPASTGIQHDETKSSLFRFAGKIMRNPPNDAALHTSVMERFLEDRVLQYDLFEVYRPSALRNHKDLKHFYDADELIRSFHESAEQRALELAAAKHDNKGPNGGAYWKQVAAEIARRTLRLKNGSGQSAGAIENATIA
jgi:hypothetical protein